MAMKKPKFNDKLVAAAKKGKLDNNPKFKQAVMKGKGKVKMDGKKVGTGMKKAKMSMKKPKMSMMKKKPMLSKKKK